MTIRFLLLTCLTCVLGCQDAPQTEAPPAAVAEGAYETTAVSGTDILRAQKKDANGNLLESGYLQNGRKQGTWTTYDGTESGPRTIVSYVAGLLDGPYIEVDEQGRYSLLANYKNNVLDGPWVKYRIGRPERTATYVDGQLDGMLTEYDYRNNKIKQEVSYKMGVQHGPLRYYNEEGKVTLEYLYENGEKVSGGIVE